MGYEVAQFVDALCFKPERRGFDSGWGHWDFLLTSSSRPHYGPGVNHIVIEMITRVIS
jgi:hypothetical protein